MKKLIWALLLGSALGQATQIRTVTSLPGTCNGGTGGVATDKVVLVTAGVGVEYTCLTPNIWVPTIGGVNSQTSSYAPTATQAVADEGATVIMNVSSGTYTLPSPPPSNKWNVSVQNINSTALTISRNGLTIDGSASNLTLQQNQGVYLTTDGTNYFTQRGIGGSAAFGSITSGTNTAAAMVVGTGASLTTSGSGTITATAVPFSGVTTASNTNTLTESGAGSIAPATTGQISSTTLFATQAGIGQVPAAPTLTNFTLSGGTLSSGNAIAVVITFNTASGESLPSLEVFSNLLTGACTTGAACTVTVALPATCTSPAAPVTGCTVYSATASGVAAKGAELQQTASAACVNVTANCVIGTIGAGASYPKKNLTGPNPLNAQNTLCGVSINPFAWFQDNSGNSQTWAGVDPFSANGRIGTPEFCTNTWFTDRAAQDQSAPQGNNAFVLIDHNAGKGTSTSNQDRALWVGYAAPTNDSATRYAEEAIQSELDFHCNGCSINGSPDGEVTVGSYQFSDLAEANYTAATANNNVLRLTYFKSGAGTPTGSSFTHQVINAQYVMNDNHYQAGNRATNYLAALNNQTGGTVNNVAWNGFECAYHASTITNGQSCIFVPSTPVPTGTGNFFIQNQIPGLPALLNGLATVSGINNNAAGTFSFNAAASISSSLTVAQATVGAPASVTCTGGASTYTYQFVGVDANGGTVASSTTNSPGTCLNPLTSGGPASVTTSVANLPSATVAKFASIDVYRTGGPMATGKIGTLTCAAAATGAGCSSFSDTGLAASGSVPTINTTGSVKAYLFETTTSCAATGTGANPSVSACGSASAGSFSCATNASTGTCQVNTTAVTGSSAIFVTQTAAKGTLLSVTCNTGSSVTAVPSVLVVSQTAGTGFTINADTFTVNPVCYDYHIVN